MTLLRPVASAVWISTLLLVTGCDSGVEVHPEHSASNGELQVGRLLGGDMPPGFRRAQPEVPLVFPLDHGPHADYRSEWWYLTFVLDGVHGEEFGAQFTLFRQAQLPGPLVPENPWQTQHLYMAHAALSDVARAQHHHAQRIGRGHPELAGVTLSPFRLGLDGWRLDSVAADFLPLQLLVADANLQLELGISAGKPRVLQGDKGYSAKGVEQGSYYYSYSRLTVTGRVRVPGADWVAVTGSAWLDREWSTSVLSPGQVGWDWFALQLDDGRDLMVYRLRRDDGQRDPFDRGLLVDVDGSSRTLTGADFALRPQGYWRDSRGACWPTQWQLSIGDERFAVSAAFADQRMDTAVTYWEGLVRVQSLADGGASAAANTATNSLGRGYMELTGYLPQTAACPEF